MKSLTAVIILASSLALGHAGDFNWGGAVSDWGTPGNWIFNSFPANSLPTSTDNVYFNNGGTATISSGTVARYYLLSFGSTPTGSGTTIVDGGTLWGTSAHIGDTRGGSGTVIISGGIWTNGLPIMVGYASTNIGNTTDIGTGALIINGGTVSCNGADIGVFSGCIGTVTVSSGLWSNSGGDIVVGDGGTGTLLINGGSITNENTYIGKTGGAGTVTASGGAWTQSGNLNVGGTLLINGSFVSNKDANIGVGSSGAGAVTVSSGSWSNTGTLYVGAKGPGSLLIDGGSVSSNGAYIGYETGYHFGAGGITVSNGGSLTNSGSLYIGNNAGVALTIETGGLVTVGNTSGETISFDAVYAGNYVLINGGYLALFGDQTGTISSLISAGHFKIWNGTAWVVSTNPSNYSLAYYSSYSAAKAATGLDNLGGYTILTNKVASSPSAPKINLIGKKTISTSKAKQTIRGTAVGEVTSVTYRIGSGKWLKAKGSASWKITITLKRGKNVITVVVTGPGGSSKPIKTVIFKK